MDKTVIIIVFFVISAVNKVTLLGRLGQDPVLRGNERTPVVTFSIATKESWKSRENDGEHNIRTEWHNIAVFNGNLQNIVMDRVKKGMRVQIEGSIKYSEYEKEGVQIRGVSIVAQDLITFDKSGSSSSSDRDEFDDLFGEGQRHNPH